MLKLFIKTGRIFLLINIHVNTFSQTHIQFLQRFKVQRPINLMTTESLKNRGKSIVLLLLFVVVATSLKQSDAGVNDWHLKNIGEVQKLEFLSNPKLLFFYSELGMFGHLDRATGNIQKRVALNVGNGDGADSQKSEKQRLIAINQVPQVGSAAAGSTHQIVVATSFNQVLVYKSETMEKIVENRFMNEKATLGEIRAYWKRQNGLLYVAGDKQLRMYPDASLDHQVVHSFDPSESVLALGEVINEDKQAETSTLILVTGTNTEVCIKEVTGKTLLATSPINKCFKTKSQAERAEIIEKQFVCVSIKTQKNSNCYDIFKASSVKILKANNVLLQKEEYSDVQNIKINKYRFIGKNNQIQISEDVVSKKITIFRNEYRLSFMENYGDSSILNVWVDFISEINYNLVIQFEDLSLSFYRQNQRRQPFQSWKREESLAYISKVLFMNTEIENSLDNPYHRKMLSHEFKSKNLVEKILGAPFDFIQRFKNEISDIKKNLLSQIGETVTGFSWISSIFQIDLKKDLKNIMKFRMSEQQERRYGLRKNIIIFTKKNTVLCLDSKTSKILWKKNLRQSPLQGKQLISLIKMKKDYQVETVIAIFYFSKEKKVVVTEIDLDGTIHTLNQFDLGTSDSSFLPTVHKLNDFSILIKGKTLHRFTINKDLSEQFNQKEYYFYKVNQKEIIGYIQGEKVIPIWNFKLSENQTLIETASSFRVDFSRIPLVDQEKVIFKNIDATNIAVVSRIGNTNTMHVYSINGRTGHVQFNQEKTGVCFDLDNHPINLAYDQNNILVTYYSLKNRLYEIWTIQQYQERVQNSALSILKDYFSGQIHNKATHNRNQIIFLSEVYGSIIPIKHMFISESKLSLIRRNMIIITPTNECYTILRELISARRPKETSIFQNQKYPPYDYLLPYNPANFFTHISLPVGLTHMRFSSTNLQSTIFVMAYGVDAFLIRMAPDKTFDMITEDFNYLVLIVIVIVVTGIVYWLRRKMKFAKLTKHHRD